MDLNNFFSFLLEKFLIISWYRYMMLPYKNLCKEFLLVFLLKNNAGVANQGKNGHIKKGWLGTKIFLHLYVTISSLCKFFAKVSFYISMSAALIKK
ncbi:MAG: hypothetical protein CV087_15485 [Candidatus Brocadia sp. WS118]|nr:MAG: hypothetical protein CV087_15485 [Candidatus Brocadia sp. WS118]